MRSVERKAAVSEVLELPGRVQSLTRTRADLAWKALIAEVHARSKRVVETLLSVCRPSTLQRLVDRVSPSVSTHQPADDCVGELGVQLVIVMVRRHLRETNPSPPGETEAPSASEHFGLFELRRHRAEIRRIFQGLKEQLWTSVVEAALREAAALVMRVEARCSEAELESIRGHLADALEERPNPLEGPGSELREVAEYIAATRVLASLGRRPHHDPAAGEHPQRAGERPEMRLQDENSRTSTFPRLVG